MKRWWSMVVVGLVAGVMLAAGPVRAGDESDTSAVGSEPSAVSGESDTWSTVGWGVLTGLANVVYVPAKLVYATPGGGTGRVAPGLTGWGTKAGGAIC